MKRTATRRKRQRPDGRWYPVLAEKIELRGRGYYSPPRIASRRGHYVLFLYVPADVRIARTRRS